MADFIWIVIALATLLAVGDVALRFLACGRAIALPERLGLAWLLGGFGAPILAALVWPWIGGGILRWVLAAFALAAWFATRRHGTASKMCSKLELLLAAILLAQAGAIAWLASASTLGWDGLIVWETKMRLIFLGQGTIPLEYFAERPFVASHPHYPLGYPAVGAWLYLFLGKIDESWLRILGPLYWASAAGILAGATVRLGGTRTAGLAAAIVLGCIPYLFGGTWGVLAGYADFPVGVAFLAAVSWIPRGHGRDSAMLCGVVAAASAWLKQEGQYLWLTVALASAGVLFVGAWKSRRWRHALADFARIALPGAIVLGGWAAFLARMQVKTDAYHSSPTIAHLADNFGRVPEVAGAIIRELAHWDAWSFLWPACAAALVLLGLRRQWWHVFVFTAALGVPLAAMIVAYALSTYDDVLLHIDLSLVRLLLQLVPAAVLLVGLSFPPAPVAREGSPFCSPPARE